MNLYVPILLAILSTVTFINAPASSMGDEDDLSSLEISRAPKRLDETIHMSGVIETYRILRESGNKVSDPELIGYLLKDLGWKEFSAADQKRIIAKVTGKDGASDVDEIIRTSSVISIYQSLRESGNKASDPELIAYILGNSRWERFSGEEHKLIIAKVIGKPAEEAVPLSAPSPLALSGPSTLDEDFELAIRLSFQDPEDEHDAYLARVIELSRQDTGGPALLDDQADEGLARVLELSRQDTGGPALLDDQVDEELARVLELSLQDQAAPKTLLEEFQQWVAQAPAHEDKHGATTTRFTLLRKDNKRK